MPKQGLFDIDCTISSFKNQYLKDGTRDYESESMFLSRSTVDWAIEKKFDHIKFVTARRFGMVQTHMTQLTRQLINHDSDRKTEEGVPLPARNTDNLLTCRLIENFLKAINYTGEFTVSMPGDRLLGYGKEYTLKVKPFETHLIETKKIFGSYQFHDSSLPLFKEETLSSDENEYDDIAKNTQLLQTIETEEEKAPGVETSYYFIDDVPRLAFLAAHQLSFLPKGATLHVFWKNYEKNTIVHIPSLHTPKEDKSSDFDKARLQAEKLFIKKVGTQSIEYLSVKTIITKLTEFLCKNRVTLPTRFFEEEHNASYIKVNSGYYSLNGYIYNIKFDVEVFEQALNDEAKKVLHDISLTPSISITTSSAPSVTSLETSSASSSTSLATNNASSAASLETSSASSSTSLATNNASSAASLETSSASSSTSLAPIISSTSTVIQIMKISLPVAPTQPSSPAMPPTTPSSVKMTHTSVVKSTTPNHTHRPRGFAFNRY